MIDQDYILGGRPGSRWTVPIPILLIVLLPLLASTVSWFVLDPLKYTFIEIKRGGGSYVDFAVAALQSLTGPRLLSIVFSVLVAVALAVWERRDKSISTAIANTRSRYQALLLIAAGVWFSHSLLVPGDLVGGDASSHIARISHVRMMLEEGSLSFWNNYFYTGSTFLEFTGALYFLLGGVLDLVIQDPNLTSKLILFSAHLFSTYLIFYLLNQRVGQFAAFAGALLYGGSLSHLHQVLWDGNHPQSLTYVLIPLSWIFADKILQESTVRAGTWFGLTLTNAVFFLHHQSMAKAFGIYLAVHCTIFIVLNLERRRLLVPLVSSAGTSIVLASVAIFPVLADKEWVMMYDTLNLFSFRFPDMSLFLTLFVWDPVPTVSASYIGVIGVLIIAFAIRLLTKELFSDPRRSWYVLSALMCLILSFCDRTQHVKFVVFILFFYSVLVAFATDQLIRRYERKPMWLCAVFLLLVVDLTSTSVQPINRTDKDYLHRAAAALAEDSGARRVLQTRTWGKANEVFASIGPGAGVISYYQIQNVTGAHNLAATLSHNYVAAMIKMVEKDLRHGLLTNETTGLLAMINVNKIVNDTGESMTLPARISSNSYSTALGHHIQIQEYPQVIFAPHLTRGDGWSRFDKPMLWNDDFETNLDHIGALESHMTKTLQQMGYDYVEGIAETIFVRDLLSIEATPTNRTVINNDVDRAGLIEVSRYTVSHQTVEIELVAPGAGLVRLPQSWSPNLRIEVNGKPTKSVQDLFNFTVVPVSGGPANIELTYLASNAVKKWAMLSLICFLLLTLWYAFTRLKHSRLARG